MSSLTITLVMLTLIAIVAGLLVLWEKKHHKKI